MDGTVATVLVKTGTATAAYEANQWLIAVAEGLAFVIF